MIKQFGIEHNLQASSPKVEDTLNDRVAREIGTVQT